MFVSPGGGGGGGFFFFLVAGLVNLILAIRRCLTLLWAALIRYGLQLWCDNFEDCVSESLPLFPPELSGALLALCDCSFNSPGKRITNGPLAHSFFEQMSQF